MFPALSQDKTVTLDLEVVPDKAHMTYSIIMGQNTMHELNIDTKISTHEIIWGDTHRPMVSCKYWSNKCMKLMIPVWNRILKRSDAEKDSVNDGSADSGHSTYTSHSGPSDKDGSTISSQPSITSDTNASFTHPIAEKSVHSNTTLANQHSIIGSNISFGTESSNM